jgi:hypothetical protein
VTEHICAGRTKFKNENRAVVRNFFMRFITNNPFIKVVKIVVLKLDLYHIILTENLIRCVELALRKGPALLVYVLFLFHALYHFYIDLPAIPVLSTVLNPGLNLILSFPEPGIKWWRNGI